MGASPKEHGYTHRKNKALEFRSATRDRYGFFPTIFAALKAQRPESKIAYYYEWEEIGDYCPSAVLDHREHIPDLADNRNAVEAIGEYIKTEKPNLALIVFNEPDHAGHAEGHGSKAYYAKLRELDRFIGIIEEAVWDAGIHDETVFIITADHGGIFWGHGGNSPRERRIPLVFFGAQIKAGHIISQPTNIYDVAPTIASLFELDPPGVWKGRAIEEIFADEYTQYLCALTFATLFCSGLILLRHHFFFRGQNPPGARRFYRHFPGPVPLAKSGLRTA
jgi:arylsulfatase A-like enzyme